MKTKFTDKELMAFADGELKGGKAMDILSDLLEETPESEILAKRLEVFTVTRNALLNVLIGEKK
tara:strand:- start:686 stop:877 length:192 start_codon:yes stop_codon:yes gene_type:complete